MAQIRNVSLGFRNESPQAESRKAKAWRGFSAEFVRMPESGELDFSWCGKSNYLALHDLSLIDGETKLDGTIRSHATDLRSRMTFVPMGCEIAGWSRLSPRGNSFVALYYDPAIIAEEVEATGSSSDGSPLLYFDDASLRSTLGKIQDLLQQDAPVTDLHAETLGMLAAIEVHQFAQAGSAARVPPSGRLSSRHERIVREFIEENLHGDISLNQLAGLVQLTRFHFARTFKKTFGLSPHAFVLHCRLERAKRMLVETDMPMSDVAESLGFGSPGQFSTMFRKSTGRTPTQFRRSG